ncbi:hypothetical protein KY346_00670 [Candidatus Woesearchaeota archaeon]|nr:hypothetical protein [Candidatus Woesearchaeota archaeon]
MSKKQTIHWQCKCEKCQHQWNTRNQTLPKLCPHCKNSNWQKKQKETN